MRTKLKVHKLGTRSNGAVAGEGANFTVILFLSTCNFHHKFSYFSFILLTLLIVSFTCSYSNISFYLVLVNLSLFVVLFPFVFVFVTVDTSCVCQIGYEIVEEGLLSVKHLITRNWN